METQGFFFSPTAVANATIDMKVFREETFGPGTRCSASATTARPCSWPMTPEYGFAAYFWTQARGASM